MKASSTFSRGKTLPNETWEVLGRTSDTALLGTSSIFPTVFPVFWECRGKICYLIKLRAVKRYLSYKVVQAYLQGSPRADPCCLPQEASRLLPPFLQGGTLVFQPSSRVGSVAAPFALVAFLGAIRKSTDRFTRMNWRKP